MGGIAQVDVRAHAAAMQAKVAARLLGPQRQTWKVYMQHALQQATPGVGMAVLLQQSKHARPPSINSRIQHSYKQSKAAVLQWEQHVHPL